jgi:hypothetical protein
MDYSNGETSVFSVFDNAYYARKQACYHIQRYIDGIGMITHCYTEESLNQLKEVNDFVKACEYANAMDAFTSYVDDNYHYDGKSWYIVEINKSSSPQEPVIIDDNSFSEQLTHINKPE